MPHFYFLSFCSAYLDTWQLLGNHCLPIRTTQPSEEWCGFRNNQCQKGQQKFIRAWNIEPVRHRVTISHWISCLVFHVCSENEAMHRGPKCVRTLQRKCTKGASHSNTGYLLNFWTFASTLGKRCFLLERTWRLSSKQGTLKVQTFLSNGPENSASYHTKEAGSNVYWPHNVHHYGRHTFMWAEVLLNYYPNFQFLTAYSLFALVQPQKVWLLHCH